MNLLKTILSTSVFAIASVALHAQLPAKVESFPVGPFLYVCRYGK